MLALSSLEALALGFVAALIVACLITICIMIHNHMADAQEDAISQAEMDYLWRRMSEHKNKP
jgi:ABC-type nitrate/sulfonate/bicarbonate transport system permease component